MFERYTEKARRVIFFARYDAIQYKADRIGTEHLLLGLLREDKSIFTRLHLPIGGDDIREEVERKVPEGQQRASFNVDLPLSEESKRVLAYAAEEAERLNDQYIGTEHLMLGLLRANDSAAAIMLIQRGADLNKLRDLLGARPPREEHEWSKAVPPRRSSHAVRQTVSIHDMEYHADYIHDRVKACLETNWHWDKRTWLPRDIAIHREKGTITFDVGLADKSPDLDVVQGGWKKDHCVICHWDIFASDDFEHASAYTNGRDWICLECHDKFVANPNYFSSNYPEIT